MRLQLAPNSVADIAELRRELDELKTAQPTSQDSGMLGFLVSSERDQYGDIVEHYNPSTGKTEMVSRVLLPPTINDYTVNTLYFEHEYVPKHGKPAAVTMFESFEATGNGITGKSSFIVEEPGAQMGYTMEILQNGSRVGFMGTPSYDPLPRRRTLQDGYYAWIMDVHYSSRIPFYLLIHFQCKASDAGIVKTRVRDYNF